MEHNDFDIIEDFDFKPINDGLGFNHKDNSLSQVKTKPLHKKDISAESVYRNVFNEEKPVVTVPNELNAFYGDDKHSRVKKDLTFKNENKIEVGLVKRFIAWFFDLSLCLGVFAVIHMLMFISTSLNMSAFVEILKANYLLPVLSFIFLYNLSYLMRGSGRSFGQSIVGIETSSKKKNEGLLKYLILKANFEILSLALIGLPQLLELEKKLFGDKVVNS